MEKKINILKQECVWEIDHDLFPFAHAATCVKNEKGDLLVVYFAGTFECKPDQGLWMSRRINGIWEKPKRIKFIYLLPHWNPVLHQDGDRIILYYKHGLNCEEWYTMMTETYDFGATWSVSKEAVPGDYSSRVATKNKMLVTEDGRWISGCSSETKEIWKCHIEISEDQGQTWVKHPIPFKNWSKEEKNETIVPGMEADGIIQPALWQSDEKAFHCLMRSSRGYIYRSDSNDGGETWCEAYPISLPNNNSGITLAQLEDKMLVLVLNPGNKAARTPLSITLSEDNGETWSEYMHLETDDAHFSYPYAITDGKTVDIVYTWRNQTIAHCEIEIISE